MQFPPPAANHREAAAKVEEDEGNILVDFPLLVSRDLF